MRIDKLTLTNFRNVGEETSYVFNPKFTVVIGKNTKGKSTVLYGLRVAAGAYLLGIPHATKRHIYNDQIHRMGAESSPDWITPTIVEAEGSVSGKQMTKPWRRVKPDLTKSTSSKIADVGEIRDCAKSNFSRANTDGIKDRVQPVIAFFGTSRLNGASRGGRGEFLEGAPFFLGYHNWFELRYNSYLYAKWLRGIDFRIEDGREPKGTKEAFYNAIRKAVPFIQRIDFDGYDFVLSVKMNGTETPMLPMHQHSDGIITFTSMVAELAFRCVVLNGHLGLNAVEQSQGIVMIDELDLHLHPTWQERVVDDLKNAFKGIQFIVTTHSPFVVKALQSKELINLDEENVSGNDPFRMSIEEVSEEMGYEVEQRAKRFEAMEKVAEEYYKLLASGESAQSNAEVQELSDKLNEFEAIYGDDPAFVAALKIERQAKGL